MPYFDPHIRWYLYALFFELFHLSCTKPQENPERPFQFVDVKECLNTGEAQLFYILDFIIFTKYSYMCSTLASKDAIEKYKYGIQYAGLSHPGCNKMFCQLIHICMTLQYFH